MNIARKYSHVRDIKTGNSIAAFAPGFDQWDSIAHVIGTDFECLRDDIDCKETEIGVDLVTVHGKPVAYIDSGFGLSDFNEIRAAAFPQEPINLLTAG